MIAKFLLPIAIALSCSFTLFSVDCAAMDEEPTVRYDQFTKFIQKGSCITDQKEKIDIEHDSKFSVITPACIFDKHRKLKILAKQPVEIKNNMLFIKDYAQEWDYIAGQYKSTKGVCDLPEKALIDLFKDTTRAKKVIRYPSFPIVFRTSENEKLSLIHLTEVYNTASAELMASYPAELGSSNITKKWIRIPNKFPQNFSALAKVCNEKGWEIDGNTRNFKHDKEKLYTTLKRLHTAQNDFEYSNFLETILRLDKEFEDAFFPYEYNGKNKNQQRISEIKNSLTPNEMGAESMKKKNCMAKALILDVLNHIEESPFDYLSSVMLHGKIVFCKNYGQMARFIDHLKEHDHIYHEGDTIFDNASASYFVLRKNVSDKDFYNKFYEIITDGNAYAVTDVRIIRAKQPNWDDTILIEIKLAEDKAEQFMNRMVYTKCDGFETKTNLIRLVIREHNGFFNLVTAYPIKPSNKYMILGTETKEEIYKKYIDFFLTEHISEETKNILKKNGKLDVIISDERDEAFKQAGIQMPDIMQIFIHANPNNRQSIK